jgi:hypothetical protein
VGEVRCLRECKRVGNISPLLYLSLRVENPSSRKAVHTATPRHPPKLACTKIEKDKLYPIKLFYSFNARP